MRPKCVQCTESSLVYDIITNSGCYLNDDFITLALLVYNVVMWHGQVISAE